MNKEKIINDLKYLKIAIEWENPLDYQTMITNAITYIENSIEQKHGHWIEELASQHGNAYDGRRWTSYHKYRCSNCQITNGNRRPDFCPHCGAKMDEVTQVCIL